ncbi:MAG TPA: hypothetical protein VFS08_01670, partial [Gemmatimonadaceae bacterium]|nr:hypothetical protein [Gemmatimonadaceae bacterium]
PSHPMRDSLSRATPRRGFLGRLAGAAAALAGGGLLTRADAAHAAPVTTTSAAPTGAAWDMSWVERVTGAHRQVFDAPEIADGTVLHQARSWLAGYAEVYGAKDAEMSAVLVIRHAAIPMVLDDAFWTRYELGERLANPDGGGEKVVLKDPATGALARRNPFLSANVRPGDRYAVIWPDGGLDALIGRGAIVLACNLALRRAVSIVAKADEVSAEAARATVLAHLVPGVVVMPNGIFAVTRAEEAGCRYIRGT